MSLANAIGMMTGAKDLKLLRFKFLKHILFTFPEFDSENSDEYKEEDILAARKEKRKLTVKSKWLRAFAVGLVDTISDKKTPGQVVYDCMDMADTMRVKNWIDKQIKTDAVEDFNEELDGEDPLIDPEPENQLEEAT